MKLSGRQNGETTCQYGILRRSHSHVIPNRFSDEESALMKLCHSERFSDQDLLLIDALSFRIASADEESALD